MEHGENDKKFLPSASNSTSATLTSDSSTLKNANNTANNKIGTHSVLKINNTNKVLQIDDVQLQKKLIDVAKTYRLKAYCPYSHFKVGAAMLANDGEIYAGCNVENISYGLAICAERNAVFHTVATLGPSAQIRAVAVATETGTSPCGACRQVLSEFVGNQNIPVFMVNTATDNVIETSLDELLPERCIIKQDDIHNK